MNIVIVGAGEVGRHAAEVLSASNHSIVLVDLDADVIERAAELLDIHTMVCSATDAVRLKEAGVGDCDLFFAATDRDEINLLSGAIANGLGADHIAARVHHSAFYRGKGLDYGRHLGIDTLICPEHLASQRIAMQLRNPGALAVEEFARGQIQMQQVIVDNKGGATHKPLRDLAFGAGVRVATVERGDKTFVPDRDTVLQLDDRVILVGESAPVGKASALLQTKKPSRVRVVIMGASPTAVWLCRALRGSQHSVRLFETDRARAEEVSLKLSHVTVVQADPTDLNVFAEEAINESDVFIAATHEDEQNILAAMQARSMNVPLTGAILERPKYLHMIEHIGINLAVSPRMVAGRELLKIVDTGPMRHLASISEGAVDVYEIRVPKRAAIGEKALKNVEFPNGCLVAAILRDGHAHVPGADDVFLGGDAVLVILRHGQAEDVSTLFLRS